MNKLAPFLGKYDTVIFDMDAVNTGEQNYWNSAALTVYEHLNRYFGRDVDPVYCMKNLSEIRKKVFFSDKIIVILKEKGVNSNWDLGYVVFCIALILNTDDSESIYRYAKALSGNILQEYDRLAELAAKRTDRETSECSRSGSLWADMRDTFQEWFLGDELFERLFKRKPSLSGKTGLLHNEQPIVSLQKLKILFELMRSKNKRICTGTGRPYHEIVYPLKAWGLFSFIAEDGLINYDHVVSAERDLYANGIEVTLTKPHPFVFLKALYGEGYKNKDLINGIYDKSKILKTLIVGDAGADILAAQAMGADFAAVLTGISGENAREYFEKMGADYILNSVEDFLSEGVVD
ncbi:MAG: HAD hydrolase-like protein [Clostridia bacterium]|nr:HAD hydrolase-like protein [Clostridia bacterium]